MTDESPQGVTMTEQEKDEEHREMVEHFRRRAYGYRRCDPQAKDKKPSGHWDGNNEYYIEHHDPNPA
jgi:hypothetical protein